MESTYDKVQYYKIAQSKKESIISKLKQIFADKEQVKSVWIFGSLTKSDSVRDIDVALHAEPKFSLKELLYLNAQVELELGLPVDMIELAEVPVSLKQRIIWEGIIVKGTKALK